MKYKGLLVILGLIAVVLYGSAFVVDETEQVVVTRFGKVRKGSYKGAGVSILSSPLWTKRMFSQESPVMGRRTRTSPYAG